jgi:NAD(P)-dependent dehydrogenase (short-subunit alcohol dehydrogenase family)
MHIELKNKITLVTGVSSGIGREIAQLLAERGARVFGTVRDPKSRGPFTGSRLSGWMSTDDASVSEAIQTIVQQAGPIQILVNNAGYSLTGSLEETSLTEAWQQLKPISLACCA